MYVMRSFSILTIVNFFQGAPDNDRIGNSPCIGESSLPNLFLPGALLCDTNSIKKEFFCDNIRQFIIKLRCRC